MKPVLLNSGFGSITVDDAELDYDIIIRLSGEVEKRKKKLSKAIFGTSHVISLDEAQHVFEDGAERLIIGAGQHGMVVLSEEAEKFFKAKNCRTDLYLTPKAIEKWNMSTDPVIGLFHITC